MPALVAAHTADSTEDDAHAIHDVNEHKEQEEGVEHCRRYVQGPLV